MRTKLSIWTLLALIAVASAGCAKLQARDNLNKGVRAFREGKYDSAIKFFEESIRLDPELTNAELYLATAYAQQYIPGAQSPDNQQKADKAIEIFGRVLQRDSNNLSAIKGLASMYQNKGDLRKAREYYIRNSEIDPMDAVPFYAIASLNYLILQVKTAPPTPEEAAQLIEEGLQNVDKALALNPDYEDAMFNKNLLYREKARLTSSEAEKEQLTKTANEIFDKAMEIRKRNQEKNRGPGGIVLDEKK